MTNEPKNVVGKLYEAFNAGDRARSTRCWPMPSSSTRTRQEFRFGIPPTGKSIRIEVFDICRIARNQIVEHWGLSDQMGLMRQLGVLSTSGG
jgi:SnoaL-like polyketide cyclase